MSKIKKLAIFMMGLPAAGKSTYAREHYGHLRILDADSIKKTHPDYDEATGGEAIHDWSTKMLAVEYAKALLDGVDFVLDGTGTNPASMVDRIRSAKMGGYDTKLVFVTVPLKTSLARNEARDRHVPKWAIMEKAESINTAFEIVSREADEVEVVDNSADNGSHGK